MENQVLKKLGRYQIIREVASGGMATVHLAVDPQLDREVALKILPSSALQNRSLRDRFEREAKTIIALEHPAIVPIYDFGEENNTPYLAMRFMSGGSLSQKLKQGPLSLPQATKILHRLGMALDFIHQQNIVHRDLKPGNVLFDMDGNAYLADFGIVKLLDETLTATAVGMMGTPAYMSPEQIQAIDEIDGRSDIYALGVMLYEMLTGKHPFRADTPFGVAYAHINQPRPDLNNTQIPLKRKVTRIIKKAMAKEAADRYDKASHLVDDLLAIISEEERVANGLPQIQTASKGNLNLSGNRWKIGAAVLGGIALLGLGLILGSSWPYGNQNEIATNPAIAVNAEDINWESAESDSSAVAIERSQVGFLLKEKDPDPVAIFKNQAVFTDQRVEIQINHLSEGLEDANLYAFSGSEVEIDHVDRRIEFEIFSGSDLFFETGSFSDGAMVDINGTGLLFSVTGSCMAIDYSLEDQIALTCFEGACFYRHEDDTPERLNVGQIATFNLANPAESPSITAVDEAGISKYGELLDLTTNGRIDKEKCVGENLLLSSEEQITSESAVDEGETLTEEIQIDLSSTAEATSSVTPSRTPRINVGTGTSVPPASSTSSPVQPSVTSAAVATSTGPGNSSQPATNTPIPVSSTSVPAATNTSAPAATSTSAPASTNTPVPAATNTPVPVPTNTPEPKPTDTPVPAPTNTPVPPPTNTPIPAPTNTLVPKPTDTPVPAPTNTPVVVRPTNTPVIGPIETPSCSPQIDCAIP